MSTGSYYTDEDIVLGQIEAIRRRQREKWGLDHDRQHEPWEWLGLITQYAAAGRYADAAALCVAASLAERANQREQEQAPTPRP